MNIILLFIALIGIITFFGSLYFSPRKCKRFLVVYMISIFIMALLYEPKGDPDIVRYYEELKSCQNKSLAEISAFMQDGLFIEHLLYWIAARISNLNFLSALSTTCVYTVTGYITCDYFTSQKKIDRNALLIFAIFQFCFLPFFSIVNNIRNVSAFALVLLALYKDLIKSQRSVSVWLLYLLPCFWHISAFLLVACRLVCAVVGRRKILGILCVLFIFSVPFIYQSCIGFLYAHPLREGNPLADFYNSFVSRLYWYVDSTTDYVNQLDLSDKYTIVTKLATVVVSILFIVRANIGKATNCGYSYTLFMEIICALSIVSNMFVAPLFWRFFSVFVIGGGPVLYKIFNTKQNKDALLMFLLVIIAIFYFIAHIRFSFEITDFAKMFRV